MRMIHFLRAAAALGAMAVVLGMAAPADAAPITVTITGGATIIGPNMGALGFNVGDTLTVTYSFDDASVVDTSPSADFGFFTFPTDTMTVQLSGYTASVVNYSIAIDVVDDVFSFGNNGYPMTSDLPAGYQVQGLSFNTQDLTRTSIATDAFMAGPTFNWNHSGFTFFVDQPISTYVIGEIFDVKVDTGDGTGTGTAPEPATLALLGLAGIGAAARRWRGRK